MRNRRSLSLSIVPAVVMGSWFMLADCVPVAAAKLLEARISLRNDVRLKAMFSVPDRSSPEEMWRRLDGLTFEATEPLAANPASTEISLGGDVRVAIVWVEKTEAQAAVGRLRLVRADDKGEHWHIPSDEVERTGIAAGLDVSRLDWRIWTGVASAAVLLLGVMALAWLRARRDRLRSPVRSVPPQQPDA